MMHCWKIKHLKINKNRISLSFPFSCRRKKFLFPFLRGTGRDTKINKRKSLSIMLNYVYTKERVDKMKETEVKEKM